MNKWSQQLEEIKTSNLYKNEIEIHGECDTLVQTKDRELDLFCSNNYIGIATNKQVIRASKQTAKQYGYGVASVRFICGTQSIHKQLEHELSNFLNTDDTILYTSCYLANVGLYNSLLDTQDIIFTHALNHASLIDGIRLCKAKRKIFNNEQELENLLQCDDTQGIRFISIDGIFSMEGTLAPLDKLYNIAQKYNCILHVDDSHATGVIGNNGKGTANYFNLDGKIDIITSTLGKSFGSIGGFTSGRKEIIELLRQKSRTYLFSNSLPPNVVGGTLKCLELLNSGESDFDKLTERITYCKQKLKQANISILAPDSPSAILSILIGDAGKSKQLANILNKKYNIYVVSFSYPVVPKNEARIRIQISSSHTPNQIDKLVHALDQELNSSWTLVTGAAGQLGSELVTSLQKKGERVLAMYNKTIPESPTCEYVVCDLTNKKMYQEINNKYNINKVYHLAAILSAIGENNPSACFNINVDSTKIILDTAIIHNQQVFFASTFGVYGKHIPKININEYHVLYPTTMYGVTKSIGEMLCDYYKDKYKLDIRALRFPGIISYKTKPGGGTTDYAIEIFYSIKDNEYTSFVNKDTRLPMIYISDSIQAIHDLMNAPKNTLTLTTYNVSGLSFTFQELLNEIKLHYPDFKCNYLDNDPRQAIADSWPQSLDCIKAIQDWNFNPTTDLKTLVNIMKTHLV